MSWIIAEGGQRDEALVRAGTTRFRLAVTAAALLTAFLAGDGGLSAAARPSGKPGEYLCGGKCQADSALRTCSATLTQGAGRDCPDGPRCQDAKLRGERRTRETARDRCVADLRAASAPPAPAPAPAPAPPAPAPPAPPAPAPRGDGGCPAGMVRVDAGPFWMGSHDGVGDADERPRHQVTVPAFCIDRTELTQAAYLAFVRATRRPEPGPCEWNGEARWQPEGTYANHPVACVSWHDARAYCEWARKRLPSEAEWEKAARGTDERTYPWGSTPAPSCERAVMDDGRFGCGAGWALAVDRTSRPRPADGASPDGVQDLAGNVWEWVEDDWHESYAVRGRPDDGTAWVDAPRGSRRVVRGGGFWYPAVLVRAALRAWVEPDDTGAARGFRCATSVEP